MSVAEASTYRLEHRAEILAILERMREERTLTTVEFGDHAIVSRVLEIRRDADALVFDIARDPESNRALCAARSLSFVSELDHIHIGFETVAPSLVALRDGPAAAVDFPTAVTRLQRREWFRAEVPVNPPIRCTVLDGSGNASPAQVVDLSCGGAGLVVDDAAFATAVPGAGHELILSLPEVGHLALVATLRTVRPTDRTTTQPRIRLGFRFDAVPAATASRIQRYVQRLEVNQLRVLKMRDR